MRYIKLTLILTVLALAFSATTFTTTHASGIQTLGCQNNSLETRQILNSLNTDVINNNCDLGLTKLVSINGGDYVSAETSAAAVSAKVGDTVSYKIKVNNLSALYNQPYGAVSINDVLPTGITPSTSSETDGTYINGVWTINLNTSTFPATLTLNGIVVSIGTFENIAAFDKYDPTNCSVLTNNAIAYADDNSSNNQDQAFTTVATVVVPLTPPVIIPAAIVAPKAPKTGFGASLNSPISDISIFILAAAGFIGAAYITRVALVKK